MGMKSYNGEYEEKLDCGEKEKMTNKQKNVEIGGELAASMIKMCDSVRGNLENANEKQEDIVKTIFSSVAATMTYLIYTMTPDTKLETLARLALEIEKNLDRM